MIKDKKVMITKSPSKFCDRWVSAKNVIILFKIKFHETKWKKNVGIRVLSCKLKLREIKPMSPASSFYYWPLLFVKYRFFRTAEAWSMILFFQQWLGQTEVFKVIGSKTKNEKIVTILYAVKDRFINTTSLRTTLLFPENIVIRD